MDYYENSDNIIENNSEKKVNTNLHNFQNLQNLHNSQNLHNLQNSQNLHNLQDSQNLQNSSIFSEYTCTFSDIDQLDGNDSTIKTNTKTKNITTKILSNFRIIEANVNSLKGKKEELKVMLERDKPDCVVLVETKLDESFSNSEFFDLDKWNIVIREDRNIYGGGLIIAVLRKYVASPVKIEYDNPDEHPELYWIKLHSFNNRKPVYICGFYRSQRDARSKNTINCLKESLQKLPGKKGQQHVVITGDANLHIDWEVNQPQTNSFTKILDEQMLNICDQFNLTQEVNFPTRLKNTLDLLLSSDPSKVTKVQPGPPFADHDCVIADFDLCLKKKPKSQHMIYKWNKADSDGLCNYVTEHLSKHSFTNDDNIDKNWNIFKDILIEARDKFVPHRLSTTRHNLPWYTQNLRRIGNKKQRLFNKARKSNLKEDIKAFKLYRSEYKRILKNAQRDYYLDFLEPKLDQNGKFLFNYIKKMKKDSTGIEALNFNNKITTNTDDKVEALAQQYESVFVKENLENIPAILPSPYPDMEDFEITENGVLTQLEGLNIHKSTGPDGLSPQLLKMLAPVISPTLTKIYKQSLSTAKSPLDWKIQFISPILKPGKNKVEPSSYRPVSLTSICSKILEHIMYSQTMKHLEKYKILSNLQHGYRNGCSTETQLLKVIDLFAKGLENNKQTDAISLDFSRAFDTVPHNRLLLKMDYYGIRKILPWINDFLSDRKQCVMIDGVKSRFVSVISGLPQGTVLAALLFLIFINDLPASVTKSFTGVFCDDTLIAKEISQKSDSLELQNDLNNIFEWTKIWGMKFNTVKCVQMTVSKKRKQFQNNYYLDKEILKKKETIKYLGVTIDNKLTFKQHIEDKSKKATTILNMLKRNLYFAPKSVKSKAYTACAQPILEYASTCWSPTSKKLNNQLEMVQHNAAKFVSNSYPKKGDYANFSITKLLNELNWESLEERRQNARLSMAYKILNGQVILEKSMMPKSQNQRPFRQCNGAKVGSANQLAEPQSRLDVVGSTFFFATPKLWNNCITPSQANAPSVDAFKAQLKRGITS